MSAAQTAEQRMAEVLASHRVNYHHRNVGGDTASFLRYTSCDGCDWLGGWHDEAGWEAHLAAALVAAGFGDVRQAGAEAFVAGWFAHARNPERLVVEDAVRAYRRESEAGGER